MKRRMFSGALIVVALVLLLTVGCEEASNTVTVDLSMHSYQPVRLKDFTTQDDALPNLSEMDEGETVQFIANELDTIFNVSLVMNLIDLLDLGPRSVEALINLSLKDESIDIYTIDYLDLIAQGGLTNLFRGQPDDLFSVDGRLRLSGKFTGLYDLLIDEDDAELCERINLDMHVYFEEGEDSDQIVIGGVMRWSVGVNFIEDDDSIAFSRYRVIYTVEIEPFEEDLDDLTPAVLVDLITITRTDGNGSTDVTEQVLALFESD